MDRPEAFRQRFPAEAIAKTIELRLEAMSYEKIAADVGRRFFMPATKIPAATVLRWVEKYVALAAEEVWKLTVKVYGPLSVEFASLRPAEGGCWLVRDLSTSYVLAARAAASFDAAAVREMMLESIPPIGELDGELFNFTFGIEEDAGGLEDYSDIIEAVTQLPYPFGRFIRLKKWDPSTFSCLVLEALSGNPCGLCGSGLCGSGGSFEARNQDSGFWTDGWSCIISS